MRSIFPALCSLLCAHSALAVIFSGPGGRGVPVNSSSLISVLDYTDTFTGTADGSSNPSRPYVPAVQPAAAYVVENPHGNPSQNFRSQTVGPGQAEFSFAADGPGQPGLVNGVPTYPGSSGAGSATGFTQTGNSVDYGIPYGLRTRYLVQIDAVASSDRIDLTSGPLPGTIFQGNSLSIFIRGDGSGNASLYNGATDTPIQSEMPGFNTGLPNDGQWHNYAVLFDQTAKTVQIFVDEQAKGTVNLTTFAGGLYQNFSNAAVGVGNGLGGGQNRAWTDNFQVGAPIPEPASLMLLGMGGLGLRRRR
jgi:PEP-CTERM motif